MLEHALIEGLTASGCDVRRIGMGPTPMLYYAEASADEVDGGIQITGSHNPANYNGFKMVFQGRPFFGEDILRSAGWRRRASGMTAPARSRPSTASSTPMSTGCSKGSTASTPTLLEARSASAGMPAMAPPARRSKRSAGRLPGEHFTLYTEVDGNFPNHHPDPTMPENLEDLRALVAEKNLDFGIAFDGDGDRIGAVDGKARIIWGDQLLMIYAEDLLRRQPGATIIADVKASRALFDRVAELGGKPLMWKTGHSLIKSKMKETKAPLAGEMSGHIFFADAYYGYDDALYAAIRLIAA